MELKKYDHDLKYGAYFEIDSVMVERESGKYYAIEQVLPIFNQKDKVIAQLKADNAELVEAIPELKRIKRGYSKAIVRNIIRHGRKENR